MLHKTLFIIYIVIGALLFTSSKGKASTELNIKSNSHSNFLKKPLQNSDNKQHDFLINIDDNDDETSSKTKYKLSRAALSFNHRFNCSKQINYSINYLSFYSKHISVNSSFSYSVLNKTAISIAFCCLKI